MDGVKNVFEIMECKRGLTKMRKLKRSLVVMLAMFMMVGTQSLTVFADEENVMEESGMSIENAKNVEKMENELDSEGVAISENENVKTEDEVNSDLANEGVETYAESDGTGTYAEEVPTSGTCGDNLTWTLLEDGTLTISGVGAMTDYASLESPFRSNDKIKKLVIEEGITSIGENAFQLCTGLTEIHIPEGVTSIGKYAFYWCAKLSSIHIPKSISSIGGSAFEGCDNLVEVSIPEGVTSIEQYTFSECRKLSSIYIPESVTSIGDRAFAGCHSLKSICIPQSVTSIGIYAFEACNLKEVYIPKGVTIIEDGVFDGCIQLKSIYIPESVIEIRPMAFRDCRELSSICIPNTVTDIGEEAFCRCKKLTEVYIPEGVTSIKWNMFSECDNLKKVTIPNSVIKIENKAFYSCVSLLEIKIPASVIQIESGAFAKCSALSTVYFDGDAPEISNDYGEEDKEETFVNVTANVYYPAGNVTYTIDNMLDYGGKLTWIAYDTTDKLEIVLEVTDKVYLIGSGGNATIKCTGELKDFVSVAVDGVLIDSSNYTVVDGSTVLTFLSSYLDTLSVGDHVVTLNYTYGSIDTTLTVLDRDTNASDSNTMENDNEANAMGNINVSSNSTQSSTMQSSTPRTGDHTLMILWGFVMMIAGCSCLVLIWTKTCVIMRKFD